MRNRTWITIVLSVIFFVVVGFGLHAIERMELNSPVSFNQERAFDHLETQMAFGPRVPGSDAHRLFSRWAIEQLAIRDWEVTTQSGKMNGHDLTNIIAKKGKGNRVIILSAHYDSRIVADQDPSYPVVSQPGPGANDGASGVAVLIELARVLKIPNDKQMWIVLFDLEDNGRLPGWEWVMGSQYFVDNLEIIPEAVVNLDMVADTDLIIYPERTSTTWINDQIWGIAARMGYENYFSTGKSHSILDDHTPFLDKGISAADIIDIDYAYYHTLEDNLDHVSADSLGIVGRVIEKWVEDY